MLHKFWRYWTTTIDAVHKPQRITDEAILQRARAAKRLLGDQIAMDAFDHVEAVLRERWAGSKVMDMDTQHELRLMLEASKNVKKALGQFVAAGRAIEERMKKDEAMIARRVKTNH